MAVGANGRIALVSREQNVSNAATAGYLKVTDAEIEAATLAIATHADGGNIHPGSSRIATDANVWRDLAKAALYAAAQARANQ